MNTPAPADYWHRAARRTARRLNAAWWLQTFAPMAVLTGALAFTVIYWRRTQGVTLDPWLTVAACAGTLFAVGGLAWWRVRPRFVAATDALVTLEARLHLHNALSAAEAGRAPWPPPLAPQPDDGFRWSWRWLSGPAFTAAALVSAALWLPIPRTLDAAAPPMVQPLAWPEMQQWMEKLQDESVVDPTQLEQLQEKLAELTAQAEKDWYSHDSLEATESLRQSLDRSIEQMASDLDAAERSLNALQNYSDQLTTESKDRLAADFQAALDGLRANELKLDPELMKQLASLDPKNLKSISQEQLNQWREAMKKNAAACKACQGGGEPGFLGDGAGKDDEDMAELMKLMAGQGEGAGSGGISRGPGAAPLFLGDTESKLGTRNQEAVSNEDLTRAAPADLIGLGEKEHQIDRSSLAPQAGGSADTGQGGERVWKDDLTPTERAVLKRYFK